ncbi:TnsA-like heteromeric transposase endonuclease subunit [Nocardia sp. NPDC060256]|uniref:TnsA-like heteromeric transposase endonuclease subunit n=1 Tax=unclassified Nocardia TaxID=2637762 RepID=UPI003658A455
MTGGGLRLVTDGVAAGGVRGFEVAFADAELGEVRRPLAEVADVAFERVAPIRSIPSYQGQRNNPGFYWSASVGAHVEFESWLERDEAMALDFDVEMVGYAAQPFWLLWTEGSQRRSHAPDFFARWADGGAVVIDCRPAQRIKPRDEVAFAATAQACAEAGWRYRLVHGHDPIWLGNVRWLAGYRHPRYRVGPVAAALREAFGEPRPLIEGVRSVGDPIAVLPVLFHLVWCAELAVDLAVRLEGWSIVTGASR